MTLNSMWFSHTIQMTWKHLLKWKTSHQLHSVGTWINECHSEIYRNRSRSVEIHVSCSKMHKYQNVQTQWKAFFSANKRKNILKLWNRKDFGSDLIKFMETLLFPLKESKLHGGMRHALLITNKTSDVTAAYERRSYSMLFSVVISPLWFKCFYGNKKVLIGSDEFHAVQKKTQSIIR